MDAGDVAIVSGIAAVFGATVGAGGAVGAAVVTGRKQAAVQHQHWRRQLRRDAYASLIAAVLEARARINSVQTSIGRGNTDAALTQLPAAVELDALHASLAVVSLEGPDEVERSALELVTTISGRVGLLLVAIDATDDVNRVLHIEMRQKEEEAHEALRSFQTLVRGLLD